MSIVTAKSTKAEIIDGACEIIATQDEQIAALKEQRTVLAILLGIASVLLLLLS